MALASYFSKNLLSLSQVLHAGSSDQFEQVLNNHVVGIALGDGSKNQEGTVPVDLTVRLISRLYPTIRFIDLTGKAKQSIGDLTKLAVSINNNIEITTANPSVIIVIGDTAIQSQNPSA